MSETTGGGMPDLSAMLSSVLANPSAMTMLSSLLSGKAGSGAVGARETAGAMGNGAASDGGVIPTLAPVKGSPTQDERAALIAALRPFLPPEKCRMIEGLLRIMELLFLLRGGRQ